MSEHKHITIGGVQYDALTGLRLDTAESASTPEPETKEPSQSHHAHSIHKKPSRTKTLNRSHVKTPHAPSVAKHPVKKSPMVHRFAPQDITPKHKKQSRVISDIAPVKHPLQHKAEMRQPAARSTPKVLATPAPRQAVVTQPAPAHKTSQQIKHEHIEKALQTSSTNHGTVKKESFIKRHPRLLSVGSASIAIVLLAGYFTYINLPSLSVRVAAAQAGIAAQYPSYKPSGYSLSGPVAFSDGKVSMKFAANVGPQSFTIDQAKSNWDSGALQENYVEQASDGSYETYNDNGLTIYTYENGAAWVNGGILHTIESNATLSGDQIRRIATSL